MTERKIITTHVYPPIPLRLFDWCAHYDNYEPPDSDGVGSRLIGWGKTEEEAILDLERAEEEDVV